MTIPSFFDTEEYLQIPIMRKFLSDHDLKLDGNKPDLISKIEQYASENPQNTKEVEEWLMKIIREGTKEICYRRIFGIKPEHRSVEYIDNKIKEKYPNCPMKSILDYENTGVSNLIEYDIIKDQNNQVSKVTFTFSSFLLQGNLNENGENVIFPVFIELLLDEEFIISRAKAKSTLFEFDDDNQFLISDDKINTMDYAVKFIDELLALFELKSNKDKHTVVSNIHKMLYRIYTQYTFTPEDVEKKVESQKELISGFIGKLFEALNLDVRNKPKAVSDAKILAEKYISINGENEDIFKNDRDAYLIKVTSDDEQALSKIDASSVKSVPLQCTEVFFDSKKAVVDSKTCRRLYLVFKRKGNIKFPKNNLLTVQLGTHNNFGYVKLLNYAEECDIQNVLQAVFGNF